MEPGMRTDTPNPEESGLEFTITKLQIHNDYITFFSKSFKLIELEQLRCTSPGNINIMPNSDNIPPVMTYQVSEEGIKINVSDEISVSPDNTTPTTDDDGVIKYYDLLDLKDSKNILWREKLGEGIKKYLKDVTIPKGRHRFRSSNEFLPHLMWLVSDRSGQCRCKYCVTPNSTTSVKRKVYAPSTRKSKRQKNVGATDVAPKSKRITRSNSAKKGNRKQVAGRTPTKKRKSEVALDIPPPVPKYAVFREGEAVWLAIDKVLNDKTLVECNKILPLHSQLEYWPAIIGLITPPDDNESNEEVIYTVKPLILHENKNVTVDSLRPWLIYSPKKSPSGKRFTRSLLNINLDQATSEQIVEIYLKAVLKASELVKIFAPVYQYDYHKVNKTKKTKEKREGKYYKAMYFGAELIYEGDLVRLMPSHSEDQGEELSYLQITSIFEDSKQGFHVTGDLYEKNKSLEKDKSELIPKNDIDEEFTLNVWDIAGRFYPMYPDITGSLTCELIKTAEYRMSILGEDDPLNIKQAANETDETVAPSNGTSKRAMKERLSVKIEEKTNTKVEIRIGNEKEITIRQTNETQDAISIEKGGSPVKFSDIERRYAKKSDDIDFPPLVVSPDTPTFETDEDNGGDSK
ncbi:9635_t:CDS:2 [Funneliformis geosporum]|uniref:14214_t:CDS:1 n=1 Tax=Funneliformis geosporum TaxID=1117311 RepID=A0A9W4SJA9_9GLOM|nr:9635_t:CDS:2 [Funneliformis geosporum]CAI2171477.1 14214_t:CDS:2 [Funneliformis geosporum]